MVAHVLALCLPPDAGAHEGRPYDNGDKRGHDDCVNLSGTRS